MLKDEPALILVPDQEILQLLSSLDALVELLAGQHLIEDVTCTEHIAFLVVHLRVVLEDLLHVHLRSRVDGRALLEGFVTLLYLPGDPEIRDLEL